MADIQEILLRVSASLGDTEEKLSAIERRLDELAHDRAEAKVGVDDGDAKAKLAEIRATLRALAAETARAHVSVEGAEAAKREIGELERALNEISHEGAGARVRLDDALARAEIDRLKLKLDELARPRTITIRSNVDKLKEDLAGIGERAASIPRLLTAFAPALIPMIGTLAQGALGLGALGIAAGGAGLAFGALGLGVKAALGGARLEQQAMIDAQQRLTDAVKSGNQQQIAAARAGVAAVQQQVNENYRAVSALKAAWTGFTGSLLSVLAPGIRAVEQGFTGMLQFVGPLLNQLQVPFHQLGEAVKTALASPEVRAGVAQLVTDFGNLVSASAPLAGPLLRAFTSLGDILINIARAAMPDLVRLVRDAADRFAEWAAKAQDIGRLHTTVHNFIATFEQIAQSLGQVVQAFAPLLAMGSALAPLVSVLANLVGGFLGLIQAMGPLGQIILTGLGVALLITRFSRLFGIISGGIGIIAGLGRALLGLAAPGAAGGIAALMERIGGSFRGVKAAIAALIAGDGIRGAINAYRDMTGATNAAKAAEDDLIPTKNREKGAAQEAQQADTSLARATSSVADAAPKAERGLAGIASKLSGFASQIPHALAKWGPAIAVGVTAAMAFGGRAVTQGAQRMWAGVTTGARAVAGQVSAAARTIGDTAAAGIRAAAGGITSAARFAFNGVASAARAVSGTVRGAVAVVMSGAQSAIAAATGPIQSAAHTVWNGISTAASSVAGPVGSAVSTVVHAGGSVISGLAGFVGGVAKGTWDNITTAARAVAGPVVSATNTVINGAGSAISSLAPFIRSVSGDTWNTIKEALAQIVETAPALAAQIPRGVGGALSAGVGEVGGAAQSVASAIRSPLESLGSGMASVGASIIQSLASGITANVGSAVAAASSAAAAIRGAFPGSEPKDPRSPLRNLAAAGHAIIANVAAGIQPGPFQAAMLRALQLPTAHLGASIPVSMQGAGATAAAAAAGSVALTANVNVNALHPADPATLREISRTVTQAQRRAVPQRPPVRV